MTGLPTRRDAVVSSEATEDLVEKWGTVERLEVLANRSQIDRRPVGAQDCADVFWVLGASRVVHIRLQLLADQSFGIHHLKRADHLISVRSMAIVSR